MSRNAAALNPGRGNRRFILLALVLGLMGAGLVYVATSRNSTSETTSSGGGLADTAVVVAKADIAARTTITADMVEVRLVSADVRSTFAYSEPNQVVGLVTRFPITANEQVLSSKVVDLSGGSAGTTRTLSYVIPEGRRAFAISASEIQNVGGLLLPGDYVDVVVLYDIEFTNLEGGRDTEDAFLAHTLLQNVEVLSVSQVVVDIVPDGAAASEDDDAAESGQRTRNSDARPNPGASTITLALTPEDAQLMDLAEANGRIRLSMRSFGDAEERPIDYTTELELIPENLPNPFLR
jgi:pilus assembly protein CpaB